MTAVAPSPSQRRSPSQWLNPLTGTMAAGLAAVIVPIVSSASGPTLCPFRLCTGHACPGCGATRAIGAALRGDLELSLRYHPLALLITFQAAVFGLLFVGGRRPQRMLLPLVLINAVALVITWLIRWKLGLLDFVVADG